MRKKKPQGTPKTPGSVFSSNPVQPHLPFAAALRGQAASQPQQEVAARLHTAPTSPKKQTPGHSVQAPTVTSDPEDMYRACTIAGQFMAELKDAASEEAKFLAIAKIVFKFMKCKGK
jgi:hypothetical protein